MQDRTAQFFSAFFRKIRDNVFTISANVLQCMVSIIGVEDRGTPEDFSV